MVKVSTVENSYLDSSLTWSHLSKTVTKVKVNDKGPGKREVGLQLKDVLVIEKKGREKTVTESLLMVGFTLEFYLPQVQLIKRTLGTGSLLMNVTLKKPSKSGTDKATLYYLLEFVTSTENV